MLSDLLPVAAHALPLVLAVALKGAVVLAVGLAIEALMRRGSAAARHAVLATALAAVVALPLLVVALPSWRVAVLPAAAPPAEAVLPSGAAVVATQPAPQHRAHETTKPPQTSGVGAGSVAEQALPLMRAPHDVAYAASQVLHHLRHAGDVLLVQVARIIPRSFWDWRAWLVLVWLFGFVVVAGRWAVAYVNAHSLLSGATPLEADAWRRLAREVQEELGIRGEVRLLHCERLAVPVAWCIGRPAVVLPADAEEWSDERRRVVLMHELAHVARQDGLTQLVAQAAVAVHWFNPLAWLSYQRMLAEREQACDDLVLAAGTRASDYAQHLLNIAARYRQESLSLTAVAAMARSAALSGRIDAILDPNRRRGGLSRRPMAVALGVAALLTVPLAAFAPVAATFQGSGGEAHEHAPAEPAASPAGTAGVPAGPTHANEHAAAVPAASDDWHWVGRASAGDLVEVYALNGSVRVREGTGSEVRVVGTPRGRNARHARLEVNEVRGGVVICVIYPGQQGCEPGRGPEGRARNTNYASVNLDVVIPQRVHLKVRTTNGSIRTDELHAAVEASSTNGSISTGSRTGDVRARTTNGAISLTANGAVEARSTNGSITATLFSTGWSGSSRMSTTNGSVRVTLPDRPDVSVDAATSTGSIRSDFGEVEVTRRRGAGATAQGTLGRGGPSLEIRTTNGGVTISRGARVSAADADQPALLATDLEVLIRESVEAGLTGVEGARIAAPATRAALAAVDVDQTIGAALGAIDWAGLEREMRLALQAASVDREAIAAEVRVALEEARAELEAVDWGELQRVLEEVVRERAAALEERRRAREAAQRQPRPSTP